MTTQKWLWIGFANNMACGASLLVCLISLLFLLLGPGRYEALLVFGLAALMNIVTAVLRPSFRLAASLAANLNMPQLIQCLKCGAYYNDNQVQCPQCGSRSPSLLEP
jgi:hypothetical protein